MKHQWRTNRRLEARPDGQQRWDRAYQQILRWSTEDAPTISTPLTPAPSFTHEETPDASSALRARLDAATQPDAKH